MHCGMWVYVGGECVYCMNVCVGGEVHYGM